MRKINWFIVVMLIAGAVSPVTAGKKKDDPGVRRVNTENLVWPLPPDKPRVRYIELWNNNLQIEPIRKRSLLDRMAGMPAKNLLQTFDKPSGIATDSKGRIYIASLTHAVVFVIDKEHKVLERITGDHGFALRSPVGVAVDEKDNLYVADSQIKAVLKFNPDHQLAASFGADQKMNTPAYVAIDEARRRIYVVDTRGHAIFVYNVDTLQYLTKVEFFGKKNKEHFEYPVGIGVNRDDGTFAVTDTGSCSVKVFDPNYKLLRSFGTQASTPGNFVRPKGVAFDSEGNIWVADAAFNNFQIFNAKGQVLMFVGQPGQDPGEFQLPNALYIDKNDRVYVGDQLNSRVQVFQFLGGK